MKRLLTGALALSLLTGTAAMAQPDRHDDRGGYDQRRDNDRGAYDQRRDDNRGNDRSRDVHQRNDERWANHHWGRGERMPSAYYQDRSRYVDYRAYHLRAPPRGYRWVRTDDNNYAMVAITTGLIASIIAASNR
jgi:Ni/Co efflux regulator RcnB